MNYDKEILNCISESFKGAKQISEETSINKSRVSIKLNKFLRFGMIMSIQGQTTKKGVKPLLYKKI